MKNFKNSVKITGYLGAKPEYHKFENGKSMARASLAFNENYESDGEKISKTNWFTLIFWNNKAEHAKDNFDKGFFVEIRGKLSNHSYEDKEGNQRVTTQIIVNQIESVNKE